MTPLSAVPRGDNPLAVGNLEMTRQRIRIAELPKLSRLRPDCPSELDHFFERALDRRGARRPGSAREPRRWLEELCEGFAAAA